MGNLWADLDKWCGLWGERILRTFDGCAVGLGEPVMGKVLEATNWSRQVNEGLSDHEEVIVG